MYSAVLLDVLEVELLANITTNSTEVEIRGLTSYTDYVFQVAAHNSIGSGPFSATFFTQTAEEGMSDQLNVK